MSGPVIAETLRRNVTRVGYWAFAALVLICALASSGMNHPGSLWPPLIALLTIILGSAPIGPEFSSGTLQLIIVKPVTRTAYLLSRVTGVLTSVWVLALLAAGVEALGRVLWRPGPFWPPLGSALAGSLVQSVLIVATLVLLGSLTRAYFNVAIYFGIQIAFGAAITALAMIRASRSAVGMFLAEHTVIERTVIALDRNLFPERPVLLDPDWMLRTLGLAAVFLTVACAAFARREVPYGAD
jgi:ABC-type transport system involved in multi-copper enzyme maturation permease subunit